MPYGDDNSYGGFGGLGGYLSNMTNNPLLLAGLQMMGNNSPRINAIPNTFEGVPNVLLAGNSQQHKFAEDARRRQEEQSKLGAMVEALKATGMEEGQARRLAPNPGAISVLQDYQTRQRQQSASDAYLRQDEPAAPAAPAADPMANSYSAAPGPGQVAPVAPAPQQQAPQQQAPQAPAPTGLGAALDPAVMQRQQQAITDAASKFDNFGLSTVNKTVSQVAGAQGNQTAGANFINAARQMGLTPESKITGDVLSDPSKASALARSVGVGADLPDDQWQVAHGEALRVSRERQAAKAAQQAQRPQQAAPYTQTGASPAVQVGTPQNTAQPVQQQAPAAQPAPQQQVGPATQQAIAEQAAGRAVMLQKQMRKEEAYLANPNASGGLKELAKLRLQNIQKELEATPDMREYALYAEQARATGEPIDPFTKWQRENKRAGAMINNINTAEGEQAATKKALLEVDKESAKKASELAMTGRRALPVANQMIELADKTPEGWKGTASPTIAKTLATLGIEVPSGASNAELFNSMSRQLLPAIRDPGSVSNYEQQQYIAAVPSLSQSADGRRKIATMYKSQIERNIEIASVYRKYMGKPELDEQLAELDAKPMFTDDQLASLESANKNPAAQRSSSGPASARRPPLSSFQR